MHPKQLLNSYQIEPKKSLGQNFLFDPNVLAQIVAAADVNAQDSVLEVGPGLGHLTKHLAVAACEVTAVELDNRFIPILNQQLAAYPNVTILHGDILDQNPNDLFATPYKVVANVPYYITGAILRHLLTADNKPTCLVMTVQKEVAERVTAVPPHMSLLAVSVQYYGQATLVTTVKAGAFWPRPGIDSAIMRIDLHPQPLLPASQEKQFFTLVKVGFSQKRKQLQKNLRQLGSSREQIDMALENADIDGRRRAETLTIAEWQALQQTFYPAI